MFCEIERGPAPKTVTVATAGRPPGKQADTTLTDKFKQLAVCLQATIKEGDGKFSDHPPSKDFLALTDDLPDNVQGDEEMCFAEASDDDEVDDSNSPFAFFSHSPARCQSSIVTSKPRTSRN